MKLLNKSPLLIILLVFTWLTSLATARDSVVVISEVHYNPASTTDDEEFIELHNLFSVDVDLSNWSLDGAVEFDFPSGTKIPAGGYLVIAKNPTALQTATGYSTALGPWTGSLKNSGENIKLVMDAIGPRTMDEVDYGDSGKWPNAPDGSGATLEKIRTNLPSDRATSWSWSHAINGTPGSARATTTLPSVVINEMNASVSGASFFIELYNRGNAGLNLNGYIISSSDLAHADVSLTTGTLSAQGFVTINTATLGYTPADGERIILYSPAKALVVDSAIVSTSPKARFPDGDDRFSRPSALTPSLANTVSIEQDIVINEILYNGFPNPGTDGTPATYNTTGVINYGDSWRYENTGAGQAQGWSTLVHNSWPSGPALIGFEPNTQFLTPHSIQTTLYTSGQMAYYFEKEFTYAGSLTNPQIRITHKIDDGAVFYLNGVELGRHNMPAGAINSTTPASGQIEVTEGVITFNAPSLISGSNRLSVEVHQGGSNSSDIVFGLEAEVLVENTPAIPGLPLTESSEEWIELHNKGTSTVNISGWRLDDAVNFDFPSNTSIGPNQYLIIAKDPVAFAAKYPGIPVVGPWSGSLSNSSDRIQLEDNNRNLADEVTYFDGGRWHAYADGGGCSLELKDPNADNSSPESWAESTTSAGWNTYTYRAEAIDNGFGLNNFNELIIGKLAAGEMLIDDISLIEDPDGTAIQFIQNGDFSSSTIGSTPTDWRAAGNHGLHGKTVVVEDGGNKALKLVATGGSKEFHNQLQKTYISGRQVVVGRTYEISYRAKWLKGDNQLNTRLFFDFLSNTQRITTSQNWGTPGAVNSTYQGNSGPTFSELSHSPTVPNVNQAVTVSVKVSDPDGLGTVRLYYRKNNTSAFSSAVMAHQGDGIYQAVITGSSGGTIAQFYVEANDSHSSVASSTFPAEGADSRAMVQWQDNQANTANLHNLRLIMRPQDRQSMYTNINTMSNYRFPGTLIVNENEVYYNIGARLKGSAYGRNNSPNDGLYIGFDILHPFNGVHKSISIERGDATNQSLAKLLMSNSGDGLPSMYDDPIRLVFPSDSLGNASKTGLALISPSRYSSAWRKSQYSNGNEGTLFNLELLYNPTTTSGSWKKSFPYNHTNGNYEFADLPLGKETYRWGFQIRSNLKRDNYEPLINASKAIGSGSVTDADKYIDLNQWARVWAFEGLIGNDDVYTRLYEHNYRMYSRPSDDRLVALPWDLDRSFRLGTSSPLIGGNNLGALLNQPTVKRLFNQHVHHLCNTTYDTSYASPWASHWTSKTGINYSSKISYISNRRNYALSQLPANVAFVITSNNGNDFSVASSTALLEGDGWINVAEIHINGNPTEVTWVDDDTWQINVPLLQGPNIITLTAHDLDGAQVGTDSITITNTSSTQLASNANLILTEIMYHPSDPTPAELAAGYSSDDDFEFIEVFNASSSQIDLSSCNFTSGITYTIPNGTMLAAGSRLIIAKNPDAFAARYSSNGKQVIGPYTGKLSNSGETVTLNAADASVILTVTYDDGTDWPEDADGDGFSMINLHPFTGTDHNISSNWSASREENGGSGEADVHTYDSWLSSHPELAAAGMTLETDDFDKDGNSNWMEYVFDSDPTDGKSVPQTLPSTEEIDLGAGADSYFTYRFTRPIAIPNVSYTPQTSAILTDNQWISDPATVNAVFHARIRNGTSETLIYRSKLPTSSNNAYFMRIKAAKTTP